MRKSFVVLAALGTIGYPVMAQDTVQPRQAPQGQEQAPPQMIKKRVCTTNELATGSRLGSKKVCKTIEVPAKASVSANEDQHQPTDRGAGN